MKAFQDLVKALSNKEEFKKYIDSMQEDLFREGADRNFINLLKDMVDFVDDNLNYDFENGYEHYNKFMDRIIKKKSNYTFFRNVINGQTNLDPDFTNFVKALNYNFIKMPVQNMVSHVITSLPDIIKRKARDNIGSVFFIAGDTSSGKTSQVEYLISTLNNFTKDFVHNVMMDAPRETLYKVSEQLYDNLEPFLKDSFGEEVPIDREKFAKDLTENFIEYLNKYKDSVILRDSSAIRTYKRPHDLISVPAEKKEVGKAELEDVLTHAPFINVDDSHNKNDPKTIKSLIQEMSEKDRPNILFMLTYNPHGLGHTHISEILELESKDKKDAGILSRRGEALFVVKRPSDYMRNLLANETQNIFYREKNNYTVLRDLLQLEHYRRLRDNEKYKLLDELYLKGINEFKDEHVRKNTLETYRNLKKTVSQLYDRLQQNFGNVAEVIKNMSDRLDNFRTSFNRFVAGYNKLGKNGLNYSFTGMNLLGLGLNEKEAKSIVENLNRLFENRNFQVGLDKIVNYAQKITKQDFNQDLTFGFGSIEDENKIAQEMQLDQEVGDIDTSRDEKVKEYEKYWNKFRENIVKIGEELKKNPDLIKKLNIPEEDISDIINLMEISSNRTTILEHANSLQAFNKFQNFGICKKEGTKLDVKLEDLEKYRNVSQTFNLIFGMKDKIKNPDIFKREAYKHMVATYGLDSPVTHAIFETFDIISSPKIRDFQSLIDSIGKIDLKYSFDDEGKVKLDKESKEQIKKFFKEIAELEDLSKVIGLKKFSSQVFTEIGKRMLRDMKLETYDPKFVENVSILFGGDEILNDDDFLDITDAMSRNFRQLYNNLSNKFRDLIDTSNNFDFDKIEFFNEEQLLDNPEHPLRKEWEDYCKSLGENKDEMHAKKSEQIANYIKNGIQSDNKLHQSTSKMLLTNMLKLNKLKSEIFK